MEVGVNIPFIVLDGRREARLDDDFFFLIKQLKARYARNMYIRKNSFVSFSLLNRHYFWREVLY
jgi:hypothetical protein